MTTAHFFEIVFNYPQPPSERQGDLEEPLDRALQEAGVGEVTGGGSGAGNSNIDVEVIDAAEGLRVIRKVLRGMRVPASTRIISRSDPQVEHRVYG